MSTNASFTPPSAPECAYEPEMTWAQAVARRDAGTLDPNCVVVITDGPVIGTAGNTSPTQIELNPVTPNDIGRTARIHTNFDNIAFAGLYNLDNNEINQVTDHWNNTISDEDAGAPTVHSQFPFHLAGPSMRDNVINDTNLTGWGALTAAVVVRDNVLQETTVNLTGTTSGAFERNQIQSGSLTSLAPTSFIRDNQLNAANVSHLGTGAGSFSFQANTMLAGSVQVDAATTAQVTINNNVTGGTAGGSRVRVNGKTDGTTIVSGNRLFNQGTAAQELLITGTGDVSVTANEIGAGDIRLNGPANATLTGCDLSGFTLTAGPGLLTLTRLEAHGGVVNHAGTGPLAMTDTQMEGATARVATDAADTQGALFITTGILGGYRIVLARTGGAQASFTASRFYGGSSDPVGDFRAAGTGGVSVISSDVSARTGGGANSQFLIDGSGVFLMTRTRVVEAQALVNPGGIVKDPLSSGNMQFVDTELINPLIRLNQSGDINIQGGRLDLACFIDHNGAGLLRMSGSILTDTDILLPTGSTRSLTLDSVVATGSSITQNGTGSGDTDNFLAGTGTVLHRAAVSLNATSAATPASTFQGVVIDSGGAMNIGDHSNANPVNNSRIESQAVLNLSGAGSFARSRIASEAVLNLTNGALASVIEGQFTKSPAGAAVNALCNAGFDNWPA